LLDFPAGSHRKFSHLLSRKGSGHAMDVWAYLLLCAAAVLWGASDALMKRFSPRELKQRKRGGGFVHLLAQDFRSLILSPAYLACLAANQVRPENQIY